MRLPLFLFHLIFVVFHLFPSALTFSSDVVNRIDSFLENTYIPYFNMTGLGIGIVKFSENGNDILSKGYGFKNLENRVKADNQTLFAIGSISKSFTATLVVKTLTEKFPQLGESVLDTPIKILLPSMNFTLSDRYRSEKTSFRDLLSHRHGLTPGMLAYQLRAYKNKEELVYRLRYTGEYHPFRTTFEYNNAVYLMAGEIIAQIANSTFENMLMNLLRDLGMTSTRLIADSDNYATIPNMSTAYYLDGNGKTKPFNMELLKWVSFSPGVGGILSTSNDMLKYILFHINNGKVGSKQIVSETAMKYLRKAAIPDVHITLKTNPDDIINGFNYYGLGFWIGLLDGWESISHSGFLPPYRSYMSFYPALKLGIFSASNGPNLYTYGTLHQVIYEIIENVQKDQKTAASTQKSTTTSTLSRSKRNVGEIQSVVSKEKVVGLYGNAFEAEFTISQGNASSNGTLYINYGLLGRGTLRPLTNTSFSIQWNSDIGQMFSLVGWKSQTIDFPRENQALFTLNFDPEGYTNILFVKNLTLDKLPTQLWTSGSC